jgi:hypothetical protein
MTLLLVLAVLSVAASTGLLLGIVLGVVTHLRRKRRGGGEV